MIIKAGLHKMKRGQKLFNANRAQVWGREQSDLRSHKGFESLGQYIKRNKRKIKENRKRA